MFVAELAGLWGLGGALLWSFARSRRGMLLVQVATLPGFALYWALRGDSAAAVATMLICWQAVLSSAFEGRRGWADRLLRGLYIASLLPLAGLAWRGDDWQSAAQATPALAALLGTALSCLARWQNDPARLRRLLLVAGLPWLVHDVLAGSAVAAVSDMVGLARAGMLVWQARSPDATSRDWVGWPVAGWARLGGMRWGWRRNLVALVSARISFANRCDGNGLRAMVRADDSEPHLCTRSPAADATDPDAMLAAMAAVRGLGLWSARA